MNGTITTIQRMSLHDGPGIRSTIFMKGCNLRCKWCHNPETWGFGKQLQHTPGKCVGCGSCIRVCEYGCIRIGPEALCLERDGCIVCGSCSTFCPSGALTTVGSDVTVEEVMEKILDDKIFYDNSCGGVTVSGGEPLLQPGFVGALLKRCKENGIHTAVETNLCVTRQTIDELVTLVDLWMCDLKFHDSRLHKQWTGAGNETIIDNLRYLMSVTGNVIVRTTVIPGVNDDEEQISRIAGLIKEAGDPLCYELLGFHVLGFDKYSSLGMVNPMEGYTEMPADRLVQLRKIIEDTGLRTNYNHYE